LRLRDLAPGRAKECTVGVLGRRRRIVSYVSQGVSTSALASFSPNVTGRRIRSALFDRLKLVSFSRRRHVPALSRTPFAS
jgi:hypothetical protein